jgi:hypothetical protein
MSVAYCFHLSLEIGAAVTGGMVAAAKCPDQLEFRNALNAVRRRKTKRLARRLDKNPEDVTREEKEQAGIMRWHIPHRKQTHWLPTGLLVALLAGLLAGMIVQTRPLAGWIMLGVLLGYWLHPLLDAFNEKPVQLVPGHWTLFLPPDVTFKLGPWHPTFGLRIKSCGFVDSVFATLCLGVSVYLAVKLAPADWQARARGAR